MTWLFLNSFFYIFHFNKIINNLHHFNFENNFYKRVAHKELYILHQYFIIYAINNINLQMVVL